MFPFDDAVDFLLTLFWAVLAGLILSVVSTGLLIWWIFA